MQPFSIHRDAMSNDHRGLRADQDTSVMRDAATGYSLQSGSDSSRRSSPSRHGTHNGDGNQANWMGVTIIEDDDLMFGGKPLCTWYEEDRRCSMGEDSEVSPCSSTDGNDEELHRGRQRDRLQDQRAGHVQQQHQQQHHRKKQEKPQH